MVLEFKFVPLTGLKEASGKHGEQIKQAITAEQGSTSTGQC